jgi:antitoxin PrlF
MTEPYATSKVTIRHQTTLPAVVREALNLEKGERLGYLIEGGEVRLVNASDLQDHRDPALNGFLELLQSDLQAHPERIRAFPPELLSRARALVRGVELDHEEPIDGVTAL